MKREVKRPEKVAVCRRCHGTGLWHHTAKDGVKYVERCPQCEGSGRVWVSGTMSLDIRPYKQNGK